MATDVVHQPLCTEAGRKLMRLAVPKNVHDESKRWFPREKIEHGFTLQNVRTILKCFCERCKRHLLQLGYNFTEGIVQRLDRYAEDIVGQSGRASSQALFALLLHIDFPILILPFLDRTMTDDNLRHFCLMDMADFEDRTALTRQLMQNWRGIGQQALQDATSSFTIRMYKFAPARFDRSEFAYYPTMAIMPFYSEVQVGHGVSASVFRTTIAEECIDRKMRLPTNNFARKKFNTNTNLRHFLQERSNLGIVKALQDPHIVSVWKSYRKGDEFNIIFPLAEGNVDDLMMKPELGFRSLTTGPLRQARIWGQMLGLARALDRIINYDTNDQSETPIFRAWGSHADGPQSQILGYHFDIKPANLLVYKDECGELVLKITDFGQAHFQHHMDDSQIGHPGGTINYAAPEGSMSRDNKLNTRYDVWSLGCVFLELIVCFLGGGWPGVERFRNQRHRVENHHANKRFFNRHPGDPRKCTLREAVVSHIDAALDRQDEASDDDNEFLRRVKILILSMLQPDIGKRWTSRQVYDYMNDMIEQNNARSQPLRTPILQEDFDTPERMVAGHRLGSLQQIYGRPRGRVRVNFERCFLQDFGTSTKLRLYVSTVLSGVPSKIGLLLDRSELELIPRYAFRKSNHRRLGDWDIIIASTDGSVVHDYEYRIGPLDEARRLQGYLTGHEIIDSFEIEDVQITEHQGVRQQGQRFFRALGGLGSNLTRRGASRDLGRCELDGTSAADHDQPPYTVQLWREAVDRSDKHLSPASDLRHRCRAVIFKSRTIITVPFTDATRSDAPEVVPMEGRPAPENRNRVSFYPTKKLNQPYIEASFLTVRDGSALPIPGIPLDLETLYESEHVTKRRLDEIKLVFRADQRGFSEDARRFAGAYIDLKQQWRRELQLM